MQWMKWISVQEKLPEDGVKVLGLAFLNDLLHFKGTYIVEAEFTRTRGWKLHTLAPDFREVTHWMPMPLPPEGENYAMD